MNRRDIIEEQIKDLEKVEEKYYNAFEGNIYNVAVYLYGRYGELPAELLEEEKLEKIEEEIKKLETLFNDNINYIVDNMILDESECEENE